MRTTFPRLTIVALLPVAALAACATTPREVPREVPREAPPASTVPATPAGAGTPAAAPPADSARRRHAGADVQFMQRMIVHHAQALEMARLVPGRTTRDAILLMAERIDATQRAEIAQMQRWLRTRGETVTSLDSLHAPHGIGHAPMPGMLTADELARLAAARGADFERLFLELMIRHHEGALAMVAELFATSGAAQESETFQLASDVDADQRAEIRRMRALLGVPPAGRDRR